MAPVANVAASAANAKVAASAVTVPIAATVVTAHRVVMVPPGVMATAAVSARAPLKKGP